MNERMLVSGWWCGKTAGNRYRAVKPAARAVESATAWFNILQGGEKCNDRPVAHALCGRDVDFLTIDVMVAHDHTCMSLHDPFCAPGSICRVA
jgi:hypothetical protein